MDAPLIELKGISKAFSGNLVLNKIDLVIHEGEVLCLVGENGCGKSTIIKIISGIYSFDEGELFIKGKNYKKILPHQSINEGIQVIYQDFSIFHNLTVAENISMGKNIHKKSKFVNWKSNRQFALNALKRIGVEMDPDVEVGSLPVAQKQIVAITRAISQTARLIVMDEPTTALTRKEIQDLLAIIRELKGQGISVVFVSHKLDEIFEVCDRIAVIRNGEKVIDKPIESFPKDKLIYYMTGKDILEEPFEYKGASDAPVLEVKNITRSGAFENVSFSVCAGEILAITGQLGSGRTELAMALFGIGGISNGKILIDRKEVKIRKRKDALKNGIAYLPEDRLTEGLFMNRSVGDNFASAIIDRIKNKFGIVHESTIKKMSDELMLRLNMTIKPYDTVTSNFSGGNQQRIVLGKWLVAKPRIFILNGPTVGVDVKSKSEIHAIIKELAAQGMVIIMISDDIEEIISTSNRVIVMNGGRISYEGLTNEVSRHELYQKIITGEENS